jgi:TPR repeat protein
MFILGKYYEFIGKNYEEMKIYYIMAIGNNSTKAMFILGNYYKDIEKNYEEMKKYYLMAIKNNCVEAKKALIFYYKSKIEINRQKIKDFEVQRNSGNIDCLETFNTDIKNNYEELKFNLTEIVNVGLTEGAFALGDYYKDIEKNYEEMKKYYLMAIDNGNLIKYKIFI